MDDSKNSFFEHKNINSNIKIMLFDINRFPKLIFINTGMPVFINFCSFIKIKNLNF